VHRVRLGAGKHASNATGIIVISDMEFFRWPEDEGIKVLWAKVPPGDDHAWYFGTPPFGKSITVR